MKNNIFNKHANVSNSPFDGHFLRLIGRSLVGLGVLILLTACTENPCGGSSRGGGGSYRGRSPC